METLQVIVGVDLDTPDIDIVAVHGLNATGDKMHAANTWTAANGKMWLKDFLPSKLTNARIMLYEYDANAAFNPTSQNVIDPAKKLLDRLLEKREHASHRPILFICHSLGGLVVKQALKIASWTKSYRKTPINNAIFGIVFFGTPHDEGNLILLGKYVSQVLRNTTSEAVSNEAFETLERDGFVAEELTEQFKGRVEDFWNISFYEDKSTTLDGEDLGKLVEKRGLFSLMKNREKTQELPGDHISLCKFDSELSENWKVVEHLLLELATDAIKARQRAEVFLKTRPKGTKVEEISLYGMHFDAKTRKRWGDLIQF